MGDQTMNAMSTMPIGMMGNPSGMPMMNGMGMMNGMMPGMVTRMKERGG